MAQSPRLDCVLNQDESLLQRERLLCKIVGAEFGGTHCGLDRPVPGNHDDLGRVVHAANSLEHFQSVDAGQPHIEQDHIKTALAQQIQAVLTAGANGGFVSFILKNAAQGFADAGFVVNDKDVGHEVYESLINV